MKKSVCIIDDDEIYQKIVSKMVERSGSFSEAKYFTQSIQALDYLKNEGSLTEIVLLDINMPQMDGWQLLREISENQPAIFQQMSIYIVSSSIAESDREKAKMFPALKGFITKPITISKLKEVAENKA
ncbi:MAG: response regulator [Christiangramia sp.]|uniref:response regulator n=1 Tax=Christiangramia sp. TaxID=1931228 RepID=UPI0032422DC6